MARSITNIFRARNTGQRFSNPEGQSKGILDDYAVRRDIKTKEGSIQAVPANAKDIANKAYVDSEILAHVDTHTGLSGKNDEADVQHLTAAQVAALHARYTDAEAVTAMGVIGNSNPLNHTRYTDAEVETVITAELVNGQSIDNAIDSLIATHAAIAAAHHTKYTDAEALTQAATLISDAVYGVRSEE